MSDFFRNMNFPRAVIVVSLLVSAVLGYFVKEKTDRLAEILVELERTPDLVREIQELGIEVDQYQELAKGSGDLDETDFTTFIRVTAADDLAGIGELEIIPSEKSPRSDIRDQMYKIRPAERSQKYSLSTLGNFLFMLEDNNPRLKVTHIKLDPFQNLKPGQVGNDQWKFEATVTARSQVANES